jgi:hypothetical protein
LTNFIFSQTNHELDWGMSSTNQQITIDVGDSVTWTWGNGTHNLRSTGGIETFDSGYFSGPGPQFSHTFTTPGVTTYICDPHPNSMFGAVTVVGTASVDEQSLLNLSLYPNPASNIINLSIENLSNVELKIELYDVIGRLNKTVNTIFNSTFDKFSIDKLIIFEAGFGYKLRFKRLCSSTEAVPTTVTAPNIELGCGSQI